MREATILSLLTRCLTMRLGRSVKHPLMCLAMMIEILQRPLLAAVTIIMKKYGKDLKDLIMSRIEMQFEFDA